MCMNMIRRWLSKMNKRLNILVLIKPFWEYAKHQPKIDMIRSIEQYANVMYWYEDGDIREILTKIDSQPDFIFHYDIAWGNGLAPNIQGLGELDIPKGCFVIDLHWSPNDRIRYFKDNKIDLIFSVSKHPFLQVFPQYEEQMVWLPWSINPHVYKNWGKEKDIDYLLMGLVYVKLSSESSYEMPQKIPPKGRYAFRDAVFEQMWDQDGFVFHPHPGHRAQANDLIVHEKYAKELNRAKIFFTCGSRSKTGAYAVLKFFEAPACNTLLLAEKNAEIEELGFIDGVNYVACTEENVLEKAAYYLLNEQKREEIVTNGYKMIHKYHTNDMRAFQIIEEIKTLIQHK